MIGNNGGGNDVSGAHGASGSSSTSPSGSGGLLKKGPWTAGEDEVLMQYVRANGEGNWNAVQKHSGLNRCGKSCRLRWANHLRPNLKKGSFNQDEERLILELHSKYGNKWARMATQLPGRTDNEIKNYWNTRVKRRKRQGLPLYPNDINNNNNQQYVHQLPSPTAITVTTPTPPTTPTNTFPFPSPQSIPFHHHHVTTPPPSHHHHHHSFDPSLTFSFQHHRPVPLLATPLARFKSYPPAHATSCSSSMLPPFVQYSPTGYDSSSALSSPVVVKTELPSNQFHHIVDAPLPEIQRIHNGGLLDDILENLLDEHHSCIHSSPELTPKEEPKEHINTLQEDLSKFLNFGPTSATIAPQPVGPPHWYNSSSGGEIPTIQPDDNITIDMQQIASFFPVVSSETATSASNYAQNPASWDSLPSICKGWYKQT